jgi:dihydrofolate reductase
MPKYVVSSTLEDPEWNNTTVLKGDVVDEATKLKEQIDGIVQTPGSLRLVQTLLEHDLVDELHLMIGAVVVGAGTPAFEGQPPAELHVIDVRKLDGSENVLVRYEVAARQG